MKGKGEGEVGRRPGGLKTTGPANRDPKKGVTFWVSKKKKHWE